MLSEIKVSLESWIVHIIPKFLPSYWNPMKKILGVAGEVLSSYQMIHSPH